MDLLASPTHLEQVRGAWGLLLHGSFLTTLYNSFVTVGTFDEEGVIKVASLLSLFQKAKGWLESHSCSLNRDEMLLLQRKWSTLNVNIVSILYSTSHPQAHFYNIEAIVSFNFLRNIKAKVSHLLLHYSRPYYTFLPQPSLSSATEHGRITDFIKASCSATSYPALCASPIFPHQLAQIALSVRAWRLGSMKLLKMLWFDLVKMYIMLEK